MANEIIDQERLLATAPTRFRSNWEKKQEEEEEGDLKEKIIVESKKIWKITVPTIVARVTSFGSLVVTQSFIGRSSGSANLAAYALVQTVTVRFVNGLLVIN